MNQVRPKNQVHPKQIFKIDHLSHSSSPTNDKSGNLVRLLNNDRRWWSRLFSDPHSRPDHHHRLIVQLFGFRFGFGFKTSPSDDQSQPCSLNNQRGGWSKSNCQRDLNAINTLQGSLQLVTHFYFSYSWDVWDCEWVSGSRLICFPEVRVPNLRSFVSNYKPKI